MKWIKNIPTFRLGFTGEHEVFGGGRNFFVFLLNVAGEFWGSAEIFNKLKKKIFSIVDVVKSHVPEIFSVHFV